MLQPSVIFCMKKCELVIKDDSGISKKSKRKFSNSANFTRKKVLKLLVKRIEGENQYH